MTQKSKTPATPVSTPEKAVETTTAPVAETKQVDVNFFVLGPSNALNMAIDGPAIREGLLDRKSVYAAGRAVDKIQKVTIADTDGNILATATADDSKWFVDLNGKTAEYERSDARKPGGWTDEAKVKHLYKDMPIEQVRDLGPDFYHLISQVSVDLGIRAGRGVSSTNATVKALRAAIEILKAKLVETGLDAAVVDAMLKPQEKQLAAAEEQAIAEEEASA